MKNNEKGAVIVEAVYVFPIMLFVIIFLIYMGNAYYLKTEVDNITTQVAVEGAALCADPFLESMKTSGKIKISAEAQMYRYIVKSYVSGIASKMEEEVSEIIGNDQQGFFIGMTTSDITPVCTAKYNSNFVEPTFSVQIVYKITFPIRFIFSDADTVLHITSNAEVPVVDTAELIQIVDMLEDYYENSGAKEKVDKVVQDIGNNIKEFLGE